MSTASNNPIDIGLALLSLIIDGTNHRSTEGSAATIWTASKPSFYQSHVFSITGQHELSRAVLQGFTIEKAWYHQSALLRVQGAYPSSMLHWLQWPSDCERGSILTPLNLAYVVVVE